MARRYAEAGATPCRCGRPAKNYRNGGLYAESLDRIQHGADLSIVFSNASGLTNACAPVHMCRCDESEFVRLQILAHKTRITFTVRRLKAKIRLECFVKFFYHFIRA